MEEEQEEEKEMAVEQGKEESTAAAAPSTPISSIPGPADTPTAPSTTTLPTPARLETPIDSSPSQAATSTSSSSLMPEPLNSWLSEEELEALKARLMSLISNDMSIDSCMQVCSTGAPLTPTKVGFEAAVECLKLLSKASLLQPLKSN